MVDSKKEKHTDRLLSLKEVKERTGISSTTLWRWQREGAFPARRRVNGYKIAWLESEIDRWIKTLPAAEGSKPYSAADIIGDAQSTTSNLVGE